MFLALGVQFPAWDIVSGFTSHVYLHEENVDGDETRVKVRGRTKQWR